MTSEHKFLIGTGVVTVAIVAIGVFFFKSQNTQTTNQPSIVSQEDLTKNARNARGNPNSLTTIVEFADLQCPACAAAHPILEKVLRENSENIYYVYYHYPLSIHRHAKAAAQAAEAAGNQGKFFEFTDLLFTNQKEWSNAGDPMEIFMSYANRLELDLDKFNQDIDDVENRVEEEFALGNKFQVASTPTFFVNGQRYEGVIPESELSNLIKTSE